LYPPEISNVGPIPYIAFIIILSAHSLSPVLIYKHYFSFIQSPCEKNPAFENGILNYRTLLRLTSPTLIIKRETLKERHLHEDGALMSLDVTDNQMVIAECVIGGRFRIRTIFIVPMYGSCPLAENVFVTEGKTEIAAAIIA